MEYLGIREHTPARPSCALPAAGLLGGQTSPLRADGMAWPAASREAWSAPVGMQKGAWMGSWGRWPYVVAAATALVVVVVASATTERAAPALGTGYAVLPEIVTGRLVLAAVIIRLPNAVAAAYLAARGRGGDAEHRLDSNTLNVAAVVVGVYPLSRAVLGYVL
jgi:uncharacterized membrane protein